MVDASEPDFIELRQQMVEQITMHTSFVSDKIGKVSLDERIIAIIDDVPRHEFVPEELRRFAYVDAPLPIGHGKTISQPFIVALMTDLLEVQPEDCVLEVGTGLGYQAAILSRLSKKVYSVEIIEELARDAELRLSKQGYLNIEFGVGDGSSGWSEHAPFDKILVAAAPELIPASLLNQLKSGGKMVIPAGVEDAQQLMLVEKDQSGRLHTQEILQVRFSPLVIAH
jgi:protein-L-isoaspartate(D-aspartate) O-methyltransferase